MTPPRTTTSGHTRALSLRLTDVLYNHLVAQAALRDITIAEAARQAIERDLNAQPDLGHGDGSPGTSMKYRTFLQLADFTAALEELQADEGDASS